ncbi:unnamed protein product [Closterium sp. Naga37s-1]|nr:unnamed protein product [Closterium sp. Naga37s-1]
MARFVYIVLASIDASSPPCCATCHPPSHPILLHALLPTAWGFIALLRCVPRGSQPCRVFSLPSIPPLLKNSAAEELPAFGMVDSLIRQVAEHLGRSGPWHQRFIGLQEVFTRTNLELQGIHDVRWLSRGDAILRAVEVFPALIVMLYEWDSSLYELATSYMFHLLLFFLADVLEQLNVLNRAFQQRELDIASVHGQIRRSISFLESRYVDCGDDFGGGVSARLSPFIKKHGPEGGNLEGSTSGVRSRSCVPSAPSLQIWRSYKKRRPFGNVAAPPAREGEGSGSKGKEALEEEEESEERHAEGRDEYDDKQASSDDDY